MKELGFFTCRWWLWRILIKQIMDKFSFQVAPTAVPKTEGRRKILKQIVQNNHSPGNPVQFSSVAQLCPTLRPHELQHAGPPCPSPTPGVYSNSCPSSRWCHPAISSSVVPFPALNPSQHQGLFQWVNSRWPKTPSIRVFYNESTLEVAKVLEFQLQHQSFQWTPRTDLL